MPLDPSVRPDGNYDREEDSPEGGQSINPRGQLPTGDMGGHGVSGLVPPESDDSRQSRLEMERLARGMVSAPPVDRNATLNLAHLAYAETISLRSPSGRVANINFGGDVVKFSGNMKLDEASQLLFEAIHARLVDARYPAGKYVQYKKEEIVKKLSEILDVDDITKREKDDDGNDCVTFNIEEAKSMMWKFVQWLIGKDIK